MAHGKSSLSISLGSTLSLFALAFDTKICAEVPLVSGIPGFPYHTNKLALPSALWNCLSLSGLFVVVLGLVPLLLMWSESSPSVDAKDAPRLNDFWLYRLLEGSRHPFGNLLTARRNGSLGNPRLHCTSAKGVPTTLTSALVFSRFLPKAARPHMAWRMQVCPSHLGGSQMAGVPLHRRP